MVHQYMPIATTIRTPHASTTAELHVVTENFGKKVSFTTAKQLSLLHVSVNTVHGVILITHQSKCVFGGIVKEKDG